MNDSSTTPKTPATGPRGRSDRAKPPQRRKSAVQRRKDRLRIIYIVVAVAMVLFLLAGVFAPVPPS